jgi:mono/diheme cytochrome c family protein
MKRPLLALAAALSLVAAPSLAADPAPPPVPAAPAPAPAAPDPEKPQPPKAPKKTPELIEAGKKVYEVNCVACHGEKGDGGGPVGLALNPKPRDFAKDPFKQGSKPEDVFLSITNGVKDTVMVGWPQLSEGDRWAVSYYVLEMVPKKGKDTKAKAKKDAAPVTP